MSHETKYPTKYLTQVFEHIQDGILIMNQDREILLMNPSAHKLTGWEIGGHVPYCTYCQNRELCTDEQGRTEERCYLVARREVPYFLSSMPTYEGKYIELEMSTAIMYENEEEGQQEVLLVLKDMTLKKKEEEARLSKLLLQKTLQAQENEHKRLAQELHDGIGQSLYSISVGIQAIRKQLEREIDKGSKFHEYAEELHAVIDGVIRDVKNYSSELRPHTLDQLGLILATRNLLQTMAKTHPEIHFALEGDLSFALPPMLVINLFRVIQEAVHNALKYANAQTIAVRIGYLQERDLVCVEIVDDGVGFDVQVSKEGLGLKHMEERIHHLGGNIRVQSQVGQGTDILVEVPYGEEEGL
jgi:PAS domain S-box-containing protein